MSDSTHPTDPREPEAGQPKPPRVRKSWTVAGHRIKKPYPDFPLTPHASGTWQKKIRGRIFYFGRWARVVNGKLTRVEGDGWKEALEQYKGVADDLHAGRTPRVDWDSLTVAELCNRFLTAKLRQLEAGEIGQRYFDDFKAVCDVLVAQFRGVRPVKDLGPDDFEQLRAAMAKRWGHVRLGIAIGRIRGVFKWGAEAGLIAQPIRFGPSFKRPSAAVLRRHRAAAGERLLEAEEIRRVLEAASPHFKAMTLLGVNAGFGNADCGKLLLSALDLERGWLNFPRPKTGIARRCPLWPETVAAVRDALAVRPKPAKAEHAGLVFITRHGLPWARDNDPGAITRRFNKLLRPLGINRPGVSFYTLRHVFRTVADAARDSVAIDLIMGHADPSMGAKYRERIDDSRLQAVVNVVRQWLFGGGPGGGATEPADAPAEDADPPQRDADSDRPRLRLYAG
jgi:integrase